MEQNGVKTGAVVWLKSGGPKMTVGVEYAAGEFYCSWFVGAEHKSAKFTLEQLTHEDPDSSSKPDWLK